MRTDLPSQWHQTQGIALTRPGDEVATEQNQAVVQAVQAMIRDLVKLAVDGVTQAILRVMEEKLAA